LSFLPKAKEQISYSENKKFEMIRGNAMSVKSNGRKYGRYIRKNVGYHLSFAQAMQIGKMFAQGKDIFELKQKFPTLFGYQTNCECCGTCPTFLPTGEYYSDIKKKPVPLTA
jgi:hypothetical protein